jgi:N-acetylglucosamine-6-phosphate deacetylase
MLITARRIDTGKICAVQIVADKIKSVHEFTGGDAQHRDGGLWIAPGLVDLQVNGYRGIDFSDPQFTYEQAESIASQMFAQGLTEFLPTVTTNAPVALIEIMQRLDQAFSASNKFSAIAAGIHLEGPFISSEDGPRGAHPARFCTAPDWQWFERWQSASGNRIRLITLSPEYDGTDQFIRQTVDAGVKVAIGHTRADSQQIAAAVAAGATLSTHLGNGAHAQIRRHPNYIWDQLACDGLYASLIVDGHHLPPNVVKSFVRCKGIEHSILVSDLTSLAGKPPGVYGNTVLGDVEVLADGKLVVAGQQQYLAGATLPLIECIGKAAAFAEIKLSDAFAMASSHAQRMMHWPVNRWQAGDVANFLLCHIDSSGAFANITLGATICDGEVAWVNSEYQEDVNLAITD